MDLEYLSTHPQNLARLIEHQRIRTTPVPGGDICTAERFTLDDGDSVFAKSLPGADPGFFPAEAAGLRWLAAAGALPIPAVIAATEQMLLLQWIDAGPPSAAAARDLGRGLAALHAAGAGCFGGPAPGWIGRLPLDNTPAPDWTSFYAERRVLPFLRAAVDAGRIEPADASAVGAVVDRLDRLGVPVEPPARCHGDLWSGNVLWSAAGPAWLIDPAAYGGHRETDLAMLDLFGVPYQAGILAAYDEVAPLGAGWAERVALHQLYPLLVHAVLVGGGYGARAGAAARRYL